MPRSLEDSHFYAILDTGYVDRTKWITCYNQLLAGGADIVQLRAKEESKPERLVLLESILPDFVASGKPLIINDDLEIAALYPGLEIGLHIGQDDADPHLARDTLGEHALIGLSTHSLPQAEAAIQLAQEGIINYFAVGPVFKTPTKPDRRAVSLQLALEVKELDPPCPFFVIGGITRETVGDVAAAGFKRIVAVSDVLQADDPAVAIHDFRKAIGAPESA